MLFYTGYLGPVRSLAAGAVFRDTAMQTVYKVTKNSVDKMAKINTLKRVYAKYSWKAVSINT